MNEQLIKKFTSRCGIEYDSDDGADDESLRKYTKLIVQECIDYCGENLSKTVGAALKIHFGVEE